MYQYWIHYFLTSWVHVTWKVSIGLLMWYAEWYAVDGEILQSFILPSPSPWNPWLYQKVRTNVFFQLYLQNLECSFKLVCSPCVHLFFLLHDVYSLNFQIDCNSDLFSDRLQDAKICNQFSDSFSGRLLRQCKLIRPRALSLTANWNILLQKDAF